MHDVCVLYSRLGKTAVNRILFGFVERHYSKKRVNIGGSRGGARGAQGSAPLFLDENEARRAEKHFFDTVHPPSQGLDDRPPPSLSEGLNPPRVNSSKCK